MITVTTNLNQIAAEILAEIEPEKQLNAIRVGALSMLALVRSRIHQDGLASDGNKIGDYSTSPIYISASANPGRSFAPNTGKTGRDRFADGRPHKSKYFSGGYSQFKTEIGRNELGSVNLSLSGQLDNQLQLIETNSGYGYGWQDTEKLERAEALESKYSKEIWMLTDSEIDQYADIIVDELFPD